MREKRENLKGYGFTRVAWGSDKERRSQVNFSAENGVKRGNP